jgi:hypothetical protein
MLLLNVMAVYAIIDEHFRFSKHLNWTLLVISVLGTVLFFYNKRMIALFNFESQFVRISLLNA